MGHGRMRRGLGRGEGACTRLFSVSVQWCALGGLGHWLHILHIAPYQSAHGRARRACGACVCGSAGCLIESDPSAAVGLYCRCEPPDPPYFIIE
eukprot:scaffold33702_cov112-Isochrysis_galbana.AAC.5